MPFYRLRSNRPLALLALAALLLALHALFTAQRAAGQNAVAAAWGQASNRGAYSFDADVTQITVPAATAANVGRSSRAERLLLSGRADLNVKRLDLRLWSGGGSLAEPATALELRVEDGKTMARQGGGPWRELSGVTEALAPQGDMLAYLSAVREVRDLGPEERAGRRFTRYAFALDGPALAGHLRDQLERQLHATGQLPPGARLEAAHAYARAEGEGELWIDAAGLPLRQIIDLRFPEQGGERIGARIVVDFSRFDAPRGLAALPADLGPIALAIALGLALTAALIAFPRSRRFAIALAVTLILALVAGPLLSSMRVRGFLDAQAAHAAEQQRDAAGGEMARTLRTLSASTAFDPHADPRIAPAAPALAPSSTAPVAVQAVANPNGDDDGDTLANAVEASIGTSSSSEDADGNGVPDGRDSDGDLVDDNVEITGFTLGGRTWRGDPLNRDSNGDGMGDTQEWLGDADGDNRPDDSDGDGTPDLFDRDNDDDGVPDRLDLSPQRSARPGDAASTFNVQRPLTLTLSNLTSGTLTLLDLQLRPADEHQLWFAQSVLDWPEDRRGQYQDHDGATFADTARAAGRTPDPSEYNGDMKLVPMLEIRAASGDGIPEQSRLTPYNISVNVRDDGSRLLYAPLSIVSDQDTGARVAFNARIPYLAGVQPQELRLVWAVQMLADVCGQSVGGECTEYRQSNSPQVIQTYDEPWLLTGVTLREDHGTTLATIYEDPDAPEETDLYEDDTLWLLAHGLDSSFLGGRSSNGSRDLDLAEIARRFDRGANNGVSEEQRWGLFNTLRVTTRSYPTYDEAVMTTAMTTTKELLSTTFSPYWSASDTRPIKPLLLFAREDSFRSQSLDTAGDGYVSLSDAGLSFDLDPVDKPAAPLVLQAGMSWSAYCATAGAGGAASWATCSNDSYWDELEQRYEGKMAQSGDTADMAAGRLTLAQLYFLSLNQGVGRIVATDGIVQAPGYTPLADRDTLSLVRSVRNGSAAVASGLLDKVILYRYVDPSWALGTLGKVSQDLTSGRTLAQRLTGAGSNLIDRIGYKAGMTVIGVAVVAVVAALAVGLYFLMKYYLAGEIGAKIAVSVLVVGISGMLSVIMPIVSVIRYVAGLQSLGVGTLSALRTVLSASSTMVGTAQMASVVGAIVATLVIWGFFIYAMVTSKTTPFSPEFNRGFAEAIAATIYVIILAVLSATVVGLIIVGIIALIDGILTAVCELGVEDLRKVPGLDGACFTLGTSATKVIAKLLYSFDVMVDVERSDLIVTGSPDVRLADQSRGFVANNPISVQLPVTTTVVHKSPAPENWMHIAPYLWQFSADNLRTSTFKYTLTRNPEALQVSRGEMDDAWTVERDRVFGATIGGVDVGQTMYRGVVRSGHEPLSGITLAPGLNRRLDFNLNIGYAVPAYECWTIPNAIPPFTPPAIPVCSTRTLDGHSSAPISDKLQLDILPDTLVGFRALISDGNGGFKLGWDPAFTGLADADGDGLRAQSHGGLDPNDSTWDADGDGLSDAFELDRRQAGLSISPLSWDTDGDGLSDGQELEFGTHPARADTDNDGLSDGDERFHQVYRFDAAQSRVVATSTWSGGWEITVPGLDFPLLVSSDPTQADPDGDSITDEAERQLAQATDPAERLDRNGMPYHPRVANASPVTIVTTISDANLVVQPGQSLIYTTTVVGESSLLAGGGLEVSSSSAALSGLPRTFPLDFASSAANVSVATVSVAAGSASGEAPITSLVKARLQSSGEPALSWADPQLGTLGTFTDKQPAQTDLAAAEPGRQDSYLAVGQARGAGNFSEFDGWDPLQKGDLPAYGLPGGQSGTVEADAGDSNSLFGSTGPRTACDEAGNCLVVWSRYQNCGQIAITSLRITDNSDETNGADIVVYYGRDNRFLQSGEQEFQRLGVWPNIDTNSAITLGNVVSSCGSDHLFIYEYDDENALPLNALPTSAAYLLGDLKLFRTTQSAQDTTFGDQAQSGRVTGSINTDAEDQPMRMVSGTVVGPDGAVRVARSDFSVPSGTAAEDWGPVAASDGTNFLVAWERTVFQSGDDQVESRIVVRRFNSAGSPAGAELVLPVEQSVGVSSYSPRPLLSLDAAWVGDAYRVIWRLSNGDLRVADFDRGGALIADSTRTLTSDTRTPRIAYDPASGRMLIVYGRSGDRIIARLLTNRSDSGVEQQLATDGATPRVAYHPIARGWLVGWSDTASLFASQSYRLIDAAGALRSDLSPPAVTWPSQPEQVDGNSLACPAAASEPVLALPFEEYPGATSFTDASAFGGGGSCADGNCPTAGVNGAGALVAPPSDFAVAFDGASQSLSANGGANTGLGSALTLAFWFRTAQTDGAANAGWNAGAGLVSSSNFGFGLSGGRLTFGIGGNRNVRSHEVADNAWHFAAATVGRGQMRLSIDGVEVQSLGGAVTPSGALQLTLGRQAAGGGFYKGALDQLQVFRTALSPAAIKALYERSSQAYCMAASPHSATLRTATLRLNRNDTRGGLINPSGGLTLLVDGDTPRSSITSPASGAQIAGPGGAITLVIGGSAADPTSEVALVEVSVNGGAFEAAEGGASWTYAATLSAGSNTIITRATDAAGNLETPGAGVTVLVDAGAPAASFDQALTAGPLAPSRRGDGSWLLRLGGPLSDPASGGQIGGGIDPNSLRVALRAADAAAGDPQGADSQQASFANGRWEASYLLPADLPDPSGVFTATLQAADLAGNQTEVTARLTLDGAGPVVSLRDDLRDVTVITGTVAIGGPGEDATGTAAAAGRLLPVEQAALLANAVMVLPFDEPAGASYFVDRTTARSDVACPGGLCPTAGESGRIDRALRFAPEHLLRSRNRFSLAAAESLTLAVWVWADGAEGELLTGGGDDGGQGQHFGLLLEGGRPMLELGTQRYTGDAALAAGWHQLAAVIDREAGSARLYVDGAAVGGGQLPAAETLGGGFLYIGGGYSGLLDEPTLIKDALNEAQIRALYATADTPWRTVALSGSSGASWTMETPAGLEGQYQLDLRATDSLGNGSFAGNSWRLVIDTRAPRLSLDAQATGRSYTDEQGLSYDEIAYSYSARDRHLDEEQLAGPCENVPERSFADLTALDGLFGDLTVRDGLSVSCTRWEQASASPPTLTACDIYGRCASAAFSRGRSAALATAAAAASADRPRALVISPTEGAVAAVGPEGSLAVQVAAEARAGLSRITLALDGVDVATLDLSAGEPLTRVVRTVTIPVPEGARTLSARAVDRSGASQEEATNVSFTADTAAPTVTLDKLTLSESDSLSAGSGMLRLSGTASDSLGLAAVQLRIGDGAFGDVTLQSDGSWSTTRWFGWGAEGDSRSVTVRALDRAGRVTDLTRTVQLDLAAPPMVETELAGGVAAITRERTATFSFTGTAAAGRSVVGFRCRLNDASFETCASPVRYSGLQPGAYSFQVYAVDDQDNTDSTPASYSWTVEGDRKVYLPLVRR